MSSPGARKTALLECSQPVLARTLRMALLEGDMTNRLDAERLEAMSNPGGADHHGRACHLDTAMVAGGMRLLQRARGPRAA